MIPEFGRWRWLRLVPWTEGDALRESEPWARQLRWRRFVPWAEGDAQRESEPWARRLGVFTLGALILVGCTGGSGGPTVTDARIPVPGEGAPGAFYLTITGGDEDDRVVGAASPQCVQTVLHESMESGDGMMTMSAVEGGVPVEAGSAVVFEPGGFHLMCLEPSGSIAPGESIPLTVAFENAGNVEVEALIEAR